MPVFSINLKIEATAYINADSKQEAIDALRSKLDRRGTDISEFDTPEISLSPAMTVWCPWGAWTNMEQVAE